MMHSNTYNDNSNLILRISTFSLFSCSPKLLATLSHCTDLTLFVRSLSGTDIVIEFEDLQTPKKCNSSVKMESFSVPANVIAVVDLSAKLVGLYYK